MIVCINGGAKMSKGYVCERCKRDNVWITFHCDNCGRYICSKCITFDFDRDKKICLDCLDKQGVRKDELIPA